MATINALIDAYISTRNKKRVVVERHKTELEPYNAGLNRLEAEMQKELLTQGVQNIKGQNGTCYLSKKVSAKIEDWSVTLDWILSNKMEHMLVHQVSRTAVEEFVDANGELPPGISMSTLVTTNVNTK